MNDSARSKKSIHDDQIPLNIENSFLEQEVESVRTVSVTFAHPEPTRSKKLTMSNILPSIELSWHNVTVKAKKKSNSYFKKIQNQFSNTEENKSFSAKNIILDNVYGIAYPGEVLAIMGGSGAGKTSLLNTLTQQNLSTVSASGSIRLNGFEIDKATLKLISAYVQQNDLFIGSMTVIEHLRFMALLRMGKRYTEYERNKRVHSVMAELNLTHIANSPIGWPHRSKGISGGERKRLAFASEIMTGSPVLFCDEPTSGLDHYLAQQVVQVLKSLAKRKNMTVIITIHQPSSQVFEMFDKICLMANGRLAFLGTTNEAINFWKSIGYPVPHNFNPADHFISTLVVDTNRSLKSLQKVNKICDSFLKSELGQKVFTDSQNEKSLSGSSNGNGNNNIENDHSTNSDETTIWCGYNGFQHKDICSFKASWLQQFQALKKRSFNITLREPMLLKVRLIQTIFIGLLLGVIYFNTLIRQTTVMNINGLLFQAIANMNFMFQFAAVHAFCDEMPIFMREHSAHLYRVDTYFLAKNVAEFPQYLLYPVVFSSILYWMSGLVRTFEAFSLFTLSCFLVTNVAISMAYASACIFGSVTVATAILPVVVVPLLAFGGFYINQQSLPFYFAPLKYLSYFGYAFETAAINQWDRIDYIPGCKYNFNTTSTTSIDLSAVLMSTKNPKLFVRDLNTCYENGAEVLNSLSFDSSNLIFDYVAMITMCIALRFIAFIALFIRTTTKK